MTNEALLTLLGIGMPWLAVPLARRLHDSRELARLRAPVAATARHGHAVVIGGGWTGLLSAAVLARYFRGGTVLERDRPPADDAPLPADDPTYVLGDASLACASALFPGFAAPI